MSIIQGAGGGGKGGKGATVPDDTMRSRAYLQLIDAISEGPIESLDEILVNRTAISNIQDSTSQFRAGMPDDQPLDGFSTTESFISVGTDVGWEVGPIIRTVVDQTIDAVKIYMAVNVIYRLDRKGAMKTADTGWRVDVRPAGGTWQEVIVRDLNSQKATSPVQFEERITLPGVGPWDIRVRPRFTSKRDKVEERVQWSGYATVVNGKLSYPHTAVVGMNLSAEHIGSSMPSRHYRIKGRKVLVPTNYDPITRTYTGSWNGTFKRAFTNCPPWILYDMVENNIFGLGDHIELNTVNKWRLYTIAQYCDQLVPSGYKDAQGDDIMEPRYTFNGVITNKQQALDAFRSITSVWRGMGFYSLSQLHATADMPQDPAFVYGPSNVVEGRFEYSTSSLKARHSVVLVRFNDPNNLFEPAIEPVIDDRALRELGWREKTLELPGCSSRSLANRYGRWVIDTERNETETAIFTVSIDSIHAMPGEVIAISDPRRVNARLSGRVASVVNSGSTRRIFLDQPVPDEIINPVRLRVQRADGSLATLEGNIHASDRTRINFNAANAPAGIDTNAVYILSSTQVEPRLYRIVSIEEDVSSGAETVLFRIVALQYDPNKFVRIEQGIEFDPVPFTLTPPFAAAPTDFRAEGRTYTSGGQVRTDIEIGWTAPPSALVREYRVFANTPSQTGVLVGTTSQTSITHSTFDQGFHEFRIVAVSHTGAVSQPLLGSFLAEGMEAIEVGIVTDLVNAATLEGGNTTFSGRDVRLSWRNMMRVSNSADVEEVDSDNAVYSHTRLEFFHGATKVRTQRVTGNSFIYTFDMNREDAQTSGSNNASRSIRVEARIVDHLGRVSPPTSIELFNPAPGAVAPAVVVEGTTLAISWGFNEDEDLSGYLVWVREDDGPVAGTTPTVVVSNNEFRFVGERYTDYWVSVAAFDAFGRNNLNFATPVQTRTTFNGADLDAEIQLLLEEAAQAGEDAREALNVARSIQDEVAASVEDAIAAAEQARNEALAAVVSAEEILADTEAARQAALQAQVSAEDVLADALAAQQAAQQAVVSAEDVLTQTLAAQQQAQQAVASAEDVFSQVQQLRDQVNLSVTDVAQVQSEVQNLASQAEAAKLAAQAAQDGAQTALNDAVAARDASLTFRNAAQAAQSAAETALNQAQTAATNAKNSASAAAGSASTATTQATNAGNSATAAAASVVAADAARNDAQGFASAASTSASSASSSATAAGTSAAAAETARTQAQTARSGAELARDVAITARDDAQGAASSALVQSGIAVTASQATLNVAVNGPALPSDFSAGVSLWTSATNGGNPNTVADALGVIVADPVMGQSLERVWTNTGFRLYHKGVTRPVSGRVYRLTVQFRLTDSTGSGNVAYSFEWLPLTETFANWTPIVINSANNAAGPNVITRSITVSDVAGEGVDFVVPGLVSTAMGRFGFRRNTAGNSIAHLVTIGLFRVEDITASILAQRSASAAATSAQAASASETAAGQSASAADTARINAQTARSGAESARDTAVTASNTATTAASTATSQASLATTAATNAANSATAASNSATTAASHATDAAQSAALSTTERNAAQTARSGAETARDVAITARNDAQGAASTATTQAGIAITARNDAQTAATASSNSASAAASSATAAGQSASTATTQANNAATSAGQASTSASQAATSATNASGSANSASTSATTSATALSDVQRALNASREVINSTPLPYLLGFGTTGEGLPDSYAATASNNAAYNSDADGPFFQRTSTGSNADVYARALVPVTPDSAIRINIRAKTNVNMSLRARIAFVAADGTVLATVNGVNVAFVADEIGTISLVLGRVAGGLVTRVQGSLANWTNAVGIRIGLSNASAVASSHFRLYSLVVDDITQADQAARSSDQAAGSASAAATSATSAAASANDAGQQAAAAQSDRIAAQTARSGAESARDTAVTAQNTATSAATTATQQATLATTARTNAENAASAASNSASAAASSATDASQSASAANTANTNAQTARSQAEVARNEAVTARNDAQGAASTATTQAGISTTATNQAIIAINANAILAGRPLPELAGFGTSGLGLPETYTPIAGSAYGSDTNGPFVRRSATTSGNVLMMRSVVPVPGNEQVFRVTARVRAVGAAVPIALRVQWLTSTGTSVQATSYQSTSVSDGEIITLSMVFGRRSGGIVTQTGGSLANWNASSYLRFGLANTSAVSGANFDLLHIQIEDLTESDLATREAAAAATSASAAATSASSAASSATDASQSASAANTSATNANTSRSQAEVARNEAVTARNDAQNAASTATTQAGIATTARNDAQTAATAASDSASAASASATAAGQSASTATTQANNAATSAGQASTSASQAATSATNAAGSASTATTQATNAANSASAAGNSATAASNSASAANTSATNAAQSASAANTSATNAQTARSGAETARNEAVTARNDAQGSASAAAQNATLAVNATLNGPILPSDFSAGLLAWTHIFEAGSPESAPNTSGTIVTDPDMGPSYRRVWANSSLRVLTKGVVRPQSGRIYRMTIRFRLENSVGSGDVGYAFCWLPLNPDFTSTENLTSIQTISSNASQGLLTRTVTVSDVAGQGVDIVVPELTTTAMGRFGFRRTTVANSIEHAVIIGSLRIEEVTSEIEALRSASASATSATNAAASATTASQQASLASSERAAAQTARSGAETARDVTITARNDAQGAASTATSNANIAVSASGQAVLAINSNAIFVGRPLPELASFGTGATGLPETYSTIANSAYGSDVNGPYVRRSAASASNFLFLRGLAPVPGNEQVFRVTLRTSAVTSAVNLNFNVRFLDGTGSQVTEVDLTAAPTAVSVSGVTTMTMTFGRRSGGLVTLTGGTLDNWNNARFIRFGVTPVTAVSGANFDVYEFKVEDITEADLASRESAAAASSATASANSASAASASATTAGQQAASATTQANNANTARTQSEAARDAAVVARQNAENAATSATTSLNLSSRIVGQGSGILRDQFLGTDAGWVTWTTAPTYTANTLYPIGRNASWNVGNTVEAGIRLRSDQHAQWEGSIGLNGYFVEVEFTLNSGGLGGSGVRIGWHNGTSDFLTSMRLENMLSGVVATGRVLRASGVFVRPANFTGTINRNEIYFFAQRNGDGMSARVAKNISVHRIFVRAATAEEMGGGAVQAGLSQVFMTSATTDTAISTAIQNLQAQVPGGLTATVNSQQTAIANLNGYTAATAALTAQLSNGRIAGIRATTHNGNGGQTNSSLLELLGDNVIAPGSISTSRLTITDLSGNLVPNGSFIFGDFRGWTAIHSSYTVVSLVAGDPSNFGVQSLADDSVRTAVMADNVPVQPGQRISSSYKFRISGSTTGNLRLRFDFWNAAGTALSAQNRDSTVARADGWHDTNHTPVVVPANAVRMRVRIERLAGSGAVLMTDFRVYRAQNAATLITPNSVTTEQLNVSELSAITANVGLLRTATTGARLEIHNNRILVFDASNNVRVRIGSLV